MKKLNNIYNHISFYLQGILLVMFMPFISIAQEQPVNLYVSAQTRQATSFNGNYAAQTDSLSYGNMVLSSSGPITFTTNVQNLVAGKNQDISWGGKVTVNLNAIPTPGTTEPAALAGAYNVNYSRAYGSGFDGNVVSTYYCNGVNCTDHPNMKGIHELVNDSGIQSLNFYVVSIMADLPDTSYIDPATLSRNIQVTSYPATGGTYKWWCDDEGVTLANTDQQEVSVSVSGNLKKAAVLHVTFQIAGISYSSQTTLLTGTCNCSDYSKLLIINDLSVNMNDDRHKTITTANPTNCSYTVKAPAFSLHMKGVIDRQLAINTGNTTLKFIKDCNSNKYKNVELDWEGNAALPGLNVGNIENAVQFVATHAHLYTDNTGKLQGEVIIHTTLKDMDVYNNGVYLIRKTEGDIIYNVNTGYDFSGLKNIEADLVKKGVTNENVVIAFFRGNMEKDGILTGILAGNNATFFTHSFGITMNELKQVFVMNVVNGNFLLSKASGNFTISNIKDLQGSAKFTFEMNPGGGIITTSNSGSLKAFGIEISQPELKADMDRNFDVYSLAGKATGKHPDLDGTFTIDYLKADNGSLSAFSAFGTARYHGFIYHLYHSNFMAATGLLNMAGSLELNLSNKAGNEIVALNGLTINSSGKINVGNIQGSLNILPANVDFTATMENNVFKGNYHGAYGSLPVSGNITIGTQDNLNYAVLSVSSLQKTPLGNSGLFLTEMNGTIGLNEDITTPGLDGTPKAGAEVFALKTTLQDESGMFTASGSGIIPFSTDPVLAIKGMVKSLPGNEIFAGNVATDYHLNQQSVETTLSSPVQLGNSQHLFSSGNSNIHFTIGNEKWTATGSAINGKIFNNSLQLENSALDITGNLQQPDKFSGNLKGVLRGDYQYPVDLTVEDGRNGNGIIKGAITFTMNNPINLPVNQDGLNGQVNTTLYGNDTLTLEIPAIGFKQTYISTTIATGTITNANGKITFQGTMDLVLGKTKYKKPLIFSF